MSKNQTARSLALECLEAISQEGAYANLVLDKKLRKSRLSPSDKGLASELVYGTLSRKLTLEWYVAHFIADRDKLEPWVYQLLLMSFYQVIYLDRVPNHAVVSEAVKLAKLRSKKGAEKLVNAVLRQLLRQPLPDMASIKRKNKRLSIQYSLPVWLVKKLVDTYGDERAQAIFASLLMPSKVSCRVVDVSQKEEIAKDLGLRPSQLSPVGLVGQGGHLANSTAFKDGAITIQDESSQLVAPTLRLKGDEQVLDACAAPGGKTAHIASYLTTGSVTALDLYDHKLALIRDNAERLHVASKVKTQKMDARTVHEHFAKDSFDKILVDAPCSGLGLLRRKPDIRYNKSELDFANLAEIQLAILESVCQTLRKGGIITYSTCTISQEENFGVINAFLAKHPEFRLVPLSHEQTDIMVDGCLLITPELYGSDGFFIAQLERMA